MEMYDANKDDFLDAKELEKAPGLKAALRNVDANHDGKISAGEIAARLRLWADGYRQETIVWRGSGIREARPRVRRSAYGRPWTNPRSSSASSTC